MMELKFCDQLITYDSDEGTVRIVQYIRVINRQMKHSVLDLQWSGWRFWDSYKNPILSWFSKSTHGMHSSWVCGRRDEDEEAHIAYSRGVSALLLCAVVPHDWTLDKGNSSCLCHTLILGRAWHGITTQSHNISYATFIFGILMPDCRGRNKIETR